VNLQNALPNAVDGAGLLVGIIHPHLALELSRELAAMSANLYEPGNISDLVQVVPGIGSKLQLVPLILYSCATSLQVCHFYGPQSSSSVNHLDVCWVGI